MAEQMTKRADATDDGIRRRDPLDLFTSLQQEMERYLQFPFGIGAFLPMRRDGRRRSTFLPRMDVYEKDNKLIFEAELPGLKKGDVHVEIEEGDLVIRGEARTQDEVKDDSFSRAERSYGSFYRRMPLSGDVNPEQVTAKLTDGVLVCWASAFAAPAPLAARYLSDEQGACHVGHC